MQSSSPSRLKHMLTVCFMLFISVQAMAQVPDSTYRKPELPTGPPVPVEQPEPQPRPRVQEKPQPKPEPVVEAKQEEEEDLPEEPLRFIDKLYVGGSFGLQFGTYTNISLLPTVSYAIRPKFFAGVGVVYHYQSNRDIKLSHYGGRAFTQLEMFEISGNPILAHAEVEALSVEAPYRDAFGVIRTDRSAMTIPMIGLGYRQRISHKGSFDILVLYNGNGDVNNPYNNPVIRVGFNIPLTYR